LGLAFINGFFAAHYKNEVIIMKLISVSRKTKNEKRFSEKMGMLTTKVVYIQKRFLNIPVKTLHKYRETYYGEMKDCEDCKISA